MYWGILADSHAETAIRNLAETYYYHLLPSTQIYPMACWLSRTPARGFVLKDPDVTSTMNESVSHSHYQNEPLICAQPQRATKVEVQTGHINSSLHLGFENTESSTILFLFFMCSCSTGCNIKNWFHAARILVLAGAAEIYAVDPNTPSQSIHSAGYSLLWKRASKNGAQGYALIHILKSKLEIFSLNSLAKRRYPRLFISHQPNIL